MVRWMNVELNKVAVDGCKSEIRSCLARQIYWLLSPITPPKTLLRHHILYYTRSFSLFPSKAKSFFLYQYLIIQHTTLACGWDKSLNDEAHLSGKMLSDWGFKNKKGAMYPLFALVTLWQGSGESRNRSSLHSHCSRLVLT